MIEFGYIFRSKDFKDAVNDPTVRKISFGFVTAAVGFMCVIAGYDIGMSRGVAQRQSFEKTKQELREISQNYYNEAIRKGNYWKMLDVKKSPSMDFFYLGEFLERNGNATAINNYSRAEAFRFASEELERSMKR